jgi:hypothetical protein
LCIAQTSLYPGLRLCGFKMGVDRGVEEMMLSP